MITILNIQIVKTMKIISLYESALNMPTRNTIFNITSNVSK